MNTPDAASRIATPRISAAIARAAAALGPGPLREDALRTHIFPLFSRILERPGIYLANHSLGRPLDQMSSDVQAALDAWYRDMDDAWGPWLDELHTFRNNIACLLGVSRADAVVPKTSAGQGLRAVLNALPSATPRILTTRGEFDSIDFILKTYHHPHPRRRAEVTWIEPHTEPDQPPRFRADDILAALERQSFDLLVVSPVFYATGQMLDQLPRVVEAARAKNTLVLLDCYHAAGVIPLALESLGADFAIGGSYKYTRGGPGACWLMIHPRHLRDDAHSEPPFRTLDTGWFAKRDTFKFQRPEQPLLATGGDAWMEATPAILPLYQAKSGLELTLALGVDRLRAYTLEQLVFLEDALRRHNIPVRRGGPDPEHSGAYLLLPHHDTTVFCDRLKARSVIADARLGHARFAPDVLTTRDELARAAAIIADTFASGTPT